MSIEARIDQLSAQVSYLTGITKRNKPHMTLLQTVFWVLAVNGVAIPAVNHLKTPYLYDALQVINEYKKIGANELGLFAGQYLFKEAPPESVQTFNAVHPNLMRIYYRANKLAAQRGFTIKIREGARTMARQKQLVKAGFSRTLNSRHLPDNSGVVHAIDLEIPYTGKIETKAERNQREWSDARKINALMQQSANYYFMDVEWGGDWKGFPDGFHFQLPWKSHPKKKRGSRKLPKSAAPANTLTDANFKRLLNNIYSSESSGKHNVESKLGGHLGLCQFGAARLVDLKLIKRSKYMLKKWDFTGDNASTSDGRQKHKEFLADSSNWTIPGGKSAFLQSRRLQNKTCIEHIKGSIETGRKLGIIKRDSTQKFIASWAKAMQFGPERALAWFISRDDRPDGNGKMTSTFAAEGSAAVRN